MSNSTVLIIGNGSDPHVAKVSAHLRSMGAQPAVFDMFRDQIALSVLDGKVSGFVTCDHGTRKVDFRDVNSVWYRHSRTCDHTSADPAVRSETRFAWTEWQNVFASMSHYCAPGRWINSVVQGHLMQRKGVQHVLASKVGLRIPDSTITNDVDSVDQLFRRNSSVVYKPNNMPTLTDGRIVFATEVDTALIRAAADEIKLAPGIFQERIERDHELRITVVGDRCFPVRIRLPGGTLERLDRRNMSPHRGNYEVATIDQSLENQILDFHRRAGLIFGGYDVIISKSGEPIFLEVNPMGEWMSLESRLNLPIAREVALELIDLGDRDNCPAVETSTINPAHATHP